MILLNVRMQKFEKIQHSVLSNFNKHSRKFNNLFSQILINIRENSTLIIASWLVSLQRNFRIYHQVQYIQSLLTHYAIINWLPPTCAFLNCYMTNFMNFFYDQLALTFDICLVYRADIDLRHTLGRWEKIYVK